MLIQRLIVVFRHSSILHHTFPEEVCRGKSTSQASWACDVNSAYAPATRLWFVPLSGLVSSHWDYQHLLWAETNRPQDWRQPLFYWHPNSCHPFYKGFLLKLRFPAISLRCLCILSSGTKCCPLFSDSLMHLLLQHCFNELSSYSLYVEFSYCMCSHLFYCQLL